MSKCKLKKYERETIIVFNEAEPKADIYTYNTSLKNRLAKFTKEHPTLRSVTRSTLAAVFPIPLTKSVCQSD